MSGLVKVDRVAASPVMDAFSMKVRRRTSFPLSALVLVAGSLSRSHGRGARPTMWPGTRSASAMHTIFSKLLTLPSPRANVPTRSGLMSHSAAIFE